MILMLLSSVTILPTHRYIDIEPELKPTVCSTVRFAESQKTSMHLRPTAARYTIPSNNPAVLKLGYLASSQIFNPLHQLPQ
ncbi:Protein of unknown function [Pyronema omphalodes CBS 100304]|uniref:Uncharacterized protein n=1 Tax=Pyronema omphalodes (strain CBS 100304) TaxID=1076935 RepID=U4L1H4_PYROM|nr:Protein of unknown function [Pyronema omphalodes CBS 100304]